MTVTDPRETESDLEVMTTTVPMEAAGARLDKYLATALEGLSRTRIKALIEAGEVTSGEIPVTDASLKLKGGEAFTLRVPELEDADPEPENIPLDIVYEDDDLLVINKAPDMVVHPAVGHRGGTLVNALLYHCGDSLSGIGGVRRPGIVHRLDRETSGLMLVAKNDAAHAHLTAQLADRTLGRVYRTIVFGVPIPPLGTVDKPIGRHPSNRLKMAAGGKDGREARTHYRVLQTFAGGLAAEVECRLESGRTHQIRVHMQAIGHPVWGDPLYGAQPTALKGAMKRHEVPEDRREALLAFPRQALHAQEIHFVHPRTEEDMSFEAPPPEDFESLVIGLSDD